MYSVIHTILNIHGELDVYNTIVRNTILTYFQSLPGPKSTMRFTEMFRNCEPPDVRILVLISVAYYISICILV